MPVKMLDHVMKRSKSDPRGVTYFRRWGFSINEGQFPNIHMSWRRGRFFFYAAFWIVRHFRVHFSIPLTVRANAN